MDRTYIKDRISACLYGGALGDALGYAVEFQSWRSIQSEYGIDGIRNLVLTEGKARFSDDTQMTLFTAEGMTLGYARARARGVSADVERYIYQAYLCWLGTQGIKTESLWDPVSRLVHIPELNCCRSPGNTCISALCSGTMGTIERPLNHSKGCGGVMRTAPLGFFRKKWNSASGSALLNGARAAAITHGHPLGWIPAGMLSDIVDRCIYEQYGSLKELVEDSLIETVRVFSDYQEIVSFEKLIRRAIEAAERPVTAEIETHTIDEPAIRQLGEGWVGEEALAIALYAVLRYPDDMKAALCTAVNHGGDSDSTGAIAGNILGAYLGMNAVPQEWLSQLELKDEIAAAAESMISVFVEE